MRRIVASLALVSVFISFATLAADVPAYTLVKDKSYLRFYAIENGAPIAGSFKDFTADIHFDPKQLDKTAISIEVNTGSVTVANDDVAQNIKLPDWLSVDKFPKATFTCNKLARFPNSDSYYAGYDNIDYCQLTLRGKKVPVTLNFQMEHMDEQKAIATGYVTLHRHDFGIGQGEWAKDDVIKDEVRVEFRITAEKK